MDDFLAEGQVWDAPRCCLHAMARWGARGTRTRLCTPLPATGIRPQREFCLREYKKVVSANAGKDGCEIRLLCKVLQGRN